VQPVTDQNGFLSQKNHNNQHQSQQKHRSKQTPKRKSKPRATNGSYKLKSSVSDRIRDRSCRVTNPTIRSHKTDPRNSGPKSRSDHRIKASRSESVTHILISPAGRRGFHARPRRRKPTCPPRPSSLPLQATFPRRKPSSARRSPTPCRIGPERSETWKKKRVSTARRGTDRGPI
jgi:hypothetical protein